jgi:DNA-binding HxlR family transcriptional regulator
MERKSFAEMDCSVAQCLEVVGEWWSMLIIRDAFLGVSRFDDLQRRLGISRNILQQRLARLVEADVLQKVAYSQHPERFDYKLTEKGRDLWPVLTAMRQWGDRYAAPAGPPLQLRHQACGEIAQCVLVCDQCGEPIGPRDVSVVTSRPHLHGAVRPPVPRRSPEMSAQPGPVAASVAMAAANSSMSASVESNAVIQRTSPVASSQV